MRRCSSWDLDRELAGNDAQVDAAPPPVVPRRSGALPLVLALFVVAVLSIGGSRPWSRRMRA